MIISRTPFRISFGGGGSDLEDFYRHEEGRVLSVTIDKYMYLVSHPFAHPDKIQLKYSKTECVDHKSKIEHPIIREALKYFEIDAGIEIGSFADIPSGTGLGSSSSFTVGLLQCLAAYTNQYVSKEFLASKACEIEIERLKEPIGKQDQYAAAYGGLNTIRFLPDGKVVVEPITISKERRELLERSLMMFSTGISRSTKEVLSEQKQNMRSQPEKLQTLKKMVKLAVDLEKVLYSGELDDFGRILDEGWQLKKSLAASISTSEIDDIYGAAIKSGALGGKLLGAGRGGYLLFYCPPARQYELLQTLKPLKALKFEFEFSGSNVIHYSNNDVYESFGKSH